MDIARKRDEAFSSSVKNLRNIVSHKGVTREGLAMILEELKELAASEELWGENYFAAPEPPEQHARYLIRQDDNEDFALYLNVMRPEKIIPPHNHTTWACIVSVEGEERNYIYRRLDDGSVPGVGRLEITKAITVGPGTGIALLPDDIHSVEITGEALIRHLHMYGRALETLSERSVFDLENGTCRTMTMAVKTRR